MLSWRRGSLWVVSCLLVAVVLVVVGYLLVFFAWCPGGLLSPGVVVVP